MFKRYNEEINDDQCLEDREKKRCSDTEVEAAIKEILKGRPLTLLPQMERQERDAILRELKTIDGSNLRQIARITGLGLHVIHKS